jgi:hypothetical protein
MYKMTGAGLLVFLNLVDAKTPDGFSQAVLNYFLWGLREC